MEDRASKYRKSPITNANHEETLTNVRYTKPASRMVFILVDVQENKLRPLPGGERSSSTRTTPTTTISIQDISSRYVREVHYLHPRYLLAIREGGSVETLLATSLVYETRHARQGLGQTRP